MSILGRRKHISIKVLCGKPTAYGDTNLHVKLNYRVSNNIASWIRIIINFTLDLKGHQTSL